jgi:hypothetical protein
MPLDYNNEHTIFCAVALNLKFEIQEHRIFSKRLSSELPEESNNFCYDVDLALITKQP